MSKLTIIENSRVSFRKDNVGDTLLRFGMLIALLIIVIANAIFTPNFFSMNTVWNLMFQCTSVMILAMGITIVIAAGGIDISVGSMMACASMVAARVMFIGPKYTVAGILISLAVSLLAGGFIGLLVSKYRIQPMIVTLAMLYVLRGIAQLLHNGGTLSVASSFFTDFAYISVWGVVPVQFFVWLFVIIVVYILLRKTRFGTFVEAFGDNPIATKISGVNTVMLVVAAHALCSFFAGIAGLLETSLANSSDPNTLGQLMELDAIAATAIGGTPMTGGRPNIAGSVAGAIIVTLITIMVNMNNIPYAWSLILKTIVLFAALYMQNMRNRKSMKMGSGV
ncbi:MAG: ABC transporter permease [Christensenellales bacterium]